LSNSYSIGRPGPTYLPGRGGCRARRAVSTHPGTDLGGAGFPAVQATRRAAPGQLKSTGPDGAPGASLAVGTGDLR